MAETLPATAAKASAQLAGLSRPSTRTYGRSSRCVFNPSTMCRVLSEIHSSLMASLTRGKMRTTSRPRASTRIPEPSASMTSINSVLPYSQGRAWNAVGFAVSAPTGQRSTTLPCSSELSARSR